MSHEVWADKCVHSYQEVPWHKLGIVSDVPTSATKVLENEWEGAALIELRPAQVFYNGAMQDTGDYAIVRGVASFDKDEAIFGYVSNRFKPVQYRDVTLMFDTMVGKPVETAGVLFKGAQIFISWKMPEFTVGVGDEYIPYAVVTVGLDNKRGGKLYTSIFRPVCANTVSMAQGWAEKNKGKNKGMIYKGTKVNPNMLKDLGYWMKFLQANAEQEVANLQSFFSLLSKTPVKNEAEVHEILYTAYPVGGQVDDYFPEELRTGTQEKLDKKGDANEVLRDNIYSLFAGRGTAIDATYMGLFNATSEALCHYMPSKKDISTSILFGNRQETMSQMANVLRDRVSK